MLIHIQSGETYPISFHYLQPHDIVDQMYDWEENFDWSVYFGQHGIAVYKMVIHGDDVIQGAIALEHREDHVWVHLIESVPRKRKEFDLIGEHLMAFACKCCMEVGFEGAVAFQSKMKAPLIQYYINVIGAKRITSTFMLIDESVAERLVMLYLCYEVIVMKKKMSLDDAARRFACGHYVEQSMPGANPERDKMVSDAIAKLKQVRSAAKVRQ